MRDPILVCSTEHQGFCPITLQGPMQLLTAALEPGLGFLRASGTLSVSARTSHHPAPWPAPPEHLAPGHVHGSPELWAPSALQHHRTDL